MYAASTALEIALPVEAAALGFSGTLLVYGVDRLRDVERDRETTPARTAFVERHRRALIALCALAAIGSATAALKLPPTVWLVCGIAGLPGLMHRRLKHVPIAKTAYVTFAWLVVCVGVPVEAGGASPSAAMPTAAVLGLALAGNLMASNLRDRESGAALVSSQTALLTALATCAGGVLAALALDLALLAPIPLLQLAAVAGLAAQPHDLERYGLVVVDGALLVGAGGVGVDLFTCLLS
jgi:4-hydroxybenzoate polyprenyltransferase